MRLQVVRTVAWGSKFYQLPPDKENTGQVTLFEKIIKFYTYINVIRVKNKKCEFLQNLYVQIFLSFVTWNSLDVYSVSPKTKKINHVET